MPLFIDTGVLSLLTHPRAGPTAKDCIRWLRDCIAAGAEAYVPEIADYELRREYMRNRSTKAIQRLDHLIEEVAEYIPLTTDAMRRAANYWAEMRNAGTPTASDDALDGDMILAAQAHTFTGSEAGAIIVTDNVEHLSRVADARNWRDMPAGEY